MSKKPNRLQEALAYSAQGLREIQNPLVRAVAQRREAQARGDPFRGDELLLTVKRPMQGVQYGREILPPSFIEPNKYSIENTINYFTGRRGKLHRPTATEPKDIPEFKKGGKVKKTGLAKVHKGELVIPANRVKAVKKAVKKAGMKPLKD